RLLRRRGAGVAADPRRGGEDLAGGAGVGLDSAQAHLRADPRGSDQPEAADLAAAGERGGREDRLIKARARTTISGTRSRARPRAAGDRAPLRGAREAAADASLPARPRRPPRRTARKGPARSRSRGRAAPRAPAPRPRRS